MKTQNTKTWSGAEAVFGVKVIATKSYCQVDEQSKSNNQTIYLKKLVKEQQTQPKASRSQVIIIIIRAKIMKQIIETQRNSIKPKAGSLERSINLTNCYLH